MLNTTFLKNKINRQIKQNGQTFTFVRYKEDKYHQVSSEELQSIQIEGLFHTTNVYISQTISDGSRVSRKPQPMILALMEQGELVEINDEVEISDKTYVVIAKTNINQFNVAIDISLELKDQDGTL